MKSRNASVFRYPPVLPSTSKSSSAAITDRSSTIGTAGTAGGGAPPPGSAIVSPANRPGRTAASGSPSGATVTLNSTGAVVGLKHIRSLQAW